MSETITAEKKAAGKTHRVVTQDAFTLIATAQGVVSFAKGDDDTYTSEPLTQSHAEDLASIEGFEAVEITGEKAEVAKPEAAKAEDGSGKIPPVHHNRRPASGGK